MSSNLWPDFKVEPKTRSPKAVIEELGKGLEEKTGSAVRFSFSGTSIKGDQVRSAFSLYSPRLGYGYPFLRAIFPVDKFYPVRVIADKVDEITANNESELIEALAKVFNSPTTIETIQRLLTLATGR